MQYLQCDNATLVHHLHCQLVGSSAGVAHAEGYLVGNGLL
jgi:hypothetical protein